MKKNRVEKFLKLIPLFSLFFIGAVTLWHPMTLEATTLLCLLLFVLGGVVVFAVKRMDRLETRQADAQSEILRERENFRNLFRQTPEMVCILKGPAHVFEFVNEAHVKVLGFSAVGMSVREAQPESIEAHVLLDEVYRTGVTQHLHEIPITVGPRLRYFDLTYAAAWDQSGAINGIVVIGMEVTEQIESRNALAASEAQIVDIIESMSDAFFSVDRFWTITRVNAQHEKATQLSRTEQVGENFLQLFLQGAESRNSKYWKNYHKVMYERVPVTFEDYYAPIDLWTLVRAYPTGDGGFAAFFTDTTAQKKINEQIEIEKQKFEAIFVESPALMALLRGSEFIFEKVNPKYSQITGNRELIGKKLHDALPEPVNQSFLALMTQVFESGKPYIGSEVPTQFILKQGEAPSEIFIDFTYSRVDDGEGRPYGIYIHAIDVTERVLARKRLEKLSRDLESAVQARDDFLSIASHELKTPLTSLKLQSQILKRRVQKNDPDAYLKERVDEIAEQTDKQVSRLNRLVDDMLDISRIRSGKLIIQRETFDFGDLVTEAFSRMRSQFLSVNLNLPTLTTCEDAVGDWDKFRMEQVINNLLTNAIRYGRGQPIAAKVTATADSVVLAVTDHGLGIAQENREKIFDRFERAVNASEISGLGLGLFITKQIVQAHGGKMWVESTLGEGSTFFVEVPRKKPDQQKVEVVHVL